MWRGSPSRQGDPCQTGTAHHASESVATMLLPIICSPMSTNSRFPPWMPWHWFG